MRFKFLMIVFICLLLSSPCLAITNIKPNGDFDNPSNTTVKYGTGWIGDASSKWNIYYTSSSVYHKAQIQDGHMIITTGSDGGINDISLGGVPSSDPSLVNWQTYGTEVNDSSTYTAFAFIMTNKSNAHYFNVRMAYANGTMLSALISPRNSGDYFQFMEYQFTVPTNIKWVRVGFVTRNADTECICYAIGAYEGVAGTLNKQTQILSISPTTSILENMQPTFTAQLYDIDADVGMVNDLELVITNSDYPNGTAFYYTYPSYIKNNLFLPEGETTDYYLNVVDLWAGNTLSDTYSLYVPLIQYIDLVGDEDTETEMPLFSETFIYFIAYVAIMVFLQSRFIHRNTIALFLIIETIVTIYLLIDYSNLALYYGSFMYIAMCLINAYLLILTGMGFKGESD